MNADTRFTLNVKPGNPQPEARSCPGIAYLPKHDMLYLLGGHPTINDQ